MATPSEGVKSETGFASNVGWEVGFMQQNNTKWELVVILWDFIPRDTLFYKIFQFKYQ